MAKSRGDFTDILVQKGILSPDQLDEARGIAQQTGAKLQDALVKLGYATMEQVMTAIAEFHGLQFVDLTDVTIPAAVIELVPESVARENVVLPLSQENGILKIIMSDPSDFDTVQKLQFILNKDITAGPGRPRADHRGHQPPLRPDRNRIGRLDARRVHRHGHRLHRNRSTAAGAAREESDAPVVKLVNLIIQEAVSLRASDIHIEPFADRVRIRYRIDGVLVERDSPPRRLLAPMLSRIKIMGSIDIAEKRRPQDGRIKMTVDGKHLRPARQHPADHPRPVGGHAYPRPRQHPGEHQGPGLRRRRLQTLPEIIKRPNGIFLVTGPTGSGKTTTLYAALNELNRPDRKIITAEDPVEYYLPGINQVK